MASIDPYLNKIKQAIYGKDVRSSICDAIKAINTQADSVTSAESSRVSAERTRVSNENTRISSENKRVSSESARTTEYNQLTDKVDALYEEMKKAIGTGVNFNTIYPVGSIFMSTTNTNPSTYFGGTWVAWAQGRVVLGMGSNGTTNYTSVNSTGGAENRAHTHASATSGTPSTTSTAGPSSNVTGAPSATNTGSPSTNVTGVASGSTGTATGNTGATTLTTAQLPAHSHSLTTVKKTSDEASGYGLTQVIGFKDRVLVYNSSGGTVSTASTGSGSSHTHTLNSHTHTLNSHTHTLNSHTHSLNAHTHTLSNHTHSLNSHTHSIPTSASTTIDVRQPYVTCYIWRRTA